MQDIRACKDIVTAITTANTQLEQVQEELKQAKQQITTEQAQLKQVREELRQAKQQVASQKQGMEREVLYICTRLFIKAYEFLVIPRIDTTHTGTKAPAQNDAIRASSK